MDLRKRIIEHHCFYWSQDRLKFMAKSYWKANSDEELCDLKIEYLQDMPPEIARKIIDYLYEDIFYNFRTFFGQEPDFKQAICFHFQPRKYEIGEVIIDEGEQVNEILLVTEGSVGIGPMIHDVQQTILKYNDGNYVLGMYSALTHRSSVTGFKVIGDKPVKALVIPRRPLLDILDYKFPQTKIHLMAMAAKINNNIKHCVNVQYYSATNKLAQSSRVWFAKDLAPLIRNLSKEPTITKNIKPLEEGIKESWRDLTQSIGEAYTALNDFHKQDEVFKQQKNIAVEEFINVIS